MAALLITHYGLYWFDFLIPIFILITLDAMPLPGSAYDIAI
jgi:hypothetical protein